MNSKLRAAVIGGVVLGLLSGIPYVRLGNIVCCLWVVLGGALASYLYIKRSAAPVNMGEGALIGALAGAIGTFVELIVGVPLTILTGYPENQLIVSLMERVDPQKAELYQQQVQRLLDRSFGEQFFYSVFSLGTLLNLLITVVLALVGGLLAVPLFEKRKVNAGLPPPPPYYGGTPGPTYGPPPPPPADYGPGT
ncbi:MAG TPA: hypothetical protein VGC87_04545 [Pyrinomonadaceae bacterium]|jgi:hypothetical protein